MRTLILTALCLIGFSPILAQEFPESLVLSADKSDTDKGIPAHNMVGRYLTNEIVADYAPALTHLVDENTGRELGTVGARRMLFGQAVQESYGDPTVRGFGKYGDAFGAWHCRPPTFDQYKLADHSNLRVEDLATYRDFLLVLKIMDRMVRANHLKTRKDFLRCWNGGPRGWRDDLHYDDPDKEQRQQDRLANTMGYYKACLIQEALVTYRDEHGISAVLWTLTPPDWLAAWQRGQPAPPH